MLDVIGTVTEDTLVVDSMESRAFGGSGYFASIAASAIIDCQLYSSVGARTSAALHALATFNIGLGNVVRTERDCIWKAGIQPTARRTIAADLSGFDAAIPRFRPSATVTYIGALLPSQQARVLAATAPESTRIVDFIGEIGLLEGHQMSSVAMQTDVLLVNEEVLPELLELLNVVRTVEILQNYELKALVVKRGAHGASYIDIAGSALPLPSPFREKLHEREAIGLGDLLGGALAAAIARSPQTCFEDAFRVSVGSLPHLQRRVRESASSVGAR